MTERKSKSPNIRINKVYTRSGDAGKTRLIGGQECYKDTKHVEAYGTVDELTANIGLCRELLIKEDNDSFNELIDFLYIVMNELFNLGTQFAVPESEHSKSLPQVSKSAVETLEKEIDKANANLTELKSFVLPGGSQINAQFHIARTVCRRAERRAVTLSHEQKLNPINLKYLNRLSDALFVWSRWTSVILKTDEQLWIPNN